MTTTTSPSPMSEHSSTLALILILAIVIGISLLLCNCTGKSAELANKIDNIGYTQPQTEHLYIVVYEIADVVYRDTILATNYLTLRNGAVFYDYHHREVAEYKFGGTSVIQSR